MPFAERLHVNASNSFTVAFYVLIGECTNIHLTKLWFLGGGVTEGVEPYKRTNETMGDYWDVNILTGNVLVRFNAHVLIEVNCDLLRLLGDDDCSPLGPDRSVASTESYRLRCCWMLLLGIR